MTRAQIDFDTYRSLERLNYDFAYYVDHHKVEELMTLFSDDIYYRHDQRISEGKAEVEALFQKRSATKTRTARHVISGLRFDRIRETMIKGTSVVVTYAGNSLPPIKDGTAHLVADFDDEYCLGQDGKWRIHKRIITRIFEAPDNPGPIGV